MRSLIKVCVALCFLFAFIDAVSARETRDRELVPRREWTREEFAGQDVPVPEYMDPYFTGASAQVDTYTVVYYDFERMDWQGWTRHDNTAQPDTFFHVDDFAGLDGGDYGGLVALEGTKSMWCGTRPGTDDYLCSWVKAPGYGNGWNQMLQTDAIPFTGLLTFSYHGYFDSEPEYDATTVEYDAGGGNWVEIARYDDVVDTVAVHELLLSQATTKLRFHFISDGAWCDQDGLWNTDGAAIVDELLITDIGGTIDYEDFEACPVGTKDTRAKCAGIWWANVKAPFGLYSGLMAGLTENDPCGQNLGTQIMFFAGSPYPSLEYPGLYDTPFCKGPGGIEEPCQDEMVVSPVIDMTKYSTGRDENQDADIPPEDLSKLGGVYLKFSIYRDLPIANLVLYTWKIRNIDESGCPDGWQGPFCYYGPEKEYRYITQSVGDKVEKDKIQVCLKVMDMCDVWYDVYGYCAAHTPAPWFDNVSIQRYETNGPQWSHRDLDLFQDNFPEVEFNLESKIRADAANDLRPNDDPVIDPGDSIVVDCASPLGGGIDTTPDGRPKVFMHLKCTYIGDPISPKPALYGPSLEGTYGHYYSDDGSTWTIIQSEVARTSSGNPVRDRYMFDLNDSLFTRGYRIDYYFKAYDHAGESRTLPHYAEAKDVYFEWTCLPTLASDILYVDDFHGRGTLDGIVQLYFDYAFMGIPWPWQPDRYDVNSPSSMVSNGPGSRAKNFHMTTAYYVVIWDSGDLEKGTITDGTEDTDKSNDCQMLADWMQFSTHRVGLWILGDNIAEELDNLTSPVSLTLMTYFCGVQHVNDSYFELTGGIEGGGLASPKVMADPNAGNPFWHTTWSDSLYVFGGCPAVNSFDVLDKTGNGEYALRYPDHGGQPYYAAVYSNGINDGGWDIRTMWFGFSFMYIRDCRPGIPIAREWMAREVMEWMQVGYGCFVGHEDQPAASSLAQNFPNPFNPVTKIRFSLREKGPVTLKIYNVAGQLVRTLVNEVREAGVYKETWDGRNNLGIDTASGVYFYRMKSGEFSKTRKMVLLR